MAVINDRIKEMRVSRGLTLLEVSKRLGVEEATMQRYESGQIKNIKHETVLALSDIFRCSPSYLMGWIDTIEDAPALESSSALTSDEAQFLSDYRNLSDQGREYMRQTMVMALHTYKKDSFVPNMEASEEIG